MADPVAEKVLSAVASVKRIACEQISLETSLQDLGFDSLDTIVLLFELEKQFQLSIPDEEARSVRRIRDIADGVGRLVANCSPHPVPPESR